jgi:putative SOS response-associated peptidase YedK
MCGRYWLKSEKKVIINEFNIYEVLTDVKPDYNITPSRNVLCVTKNGNNKLVSMRWGLIPHWAKDEKIGFRTINARADTLAEKPTFLKPFQSQRCLIVADGYYEWRKQGAQKTPLAFQLKSHKPFGFAGLYDRWQSPNNDIIVSCTIVTTEPNKLTTPIHNRMPAILSSKAYDVWLDKNIHDLQKLLSLLVPYNSEEMEAYEVSSMVNSPQNNNPNLIKPVGKSTLF